MNLPTLIDTEDNALDVLQKATSGISQYEPGLSQDEVDLINRIKGQLQNDHLIQKDWLLAADALELNGSALFALAKQPKIPEISLPSHIQQWVLPFGTYSVNAYAIHTRPGNCVLIDAGFETEPYFYRLDQLNLKPTALLITHNHRDHVGTMKALLERFPDMPVYANDPHLSHLAAPLSHCMSFTLDTLNVTARQIPGHALDALAFEINDEGHTFLAAGDGIYACSAGKIPTNYKKGLQVLRTEVLDKNPYAFILPGHGPITRVAEERLRNPFFAGFYV